MRIEKRAKIYTRAFRYLTPYWRQEALILCLMLAATLLSLPQPVAVKLLIDEVLVNRNAPLLYLIITGLLACYGLNALVTWLLNLYSNRIHQRIVVDVRGTLYDHIHTLGPEYYQNTQTGDMMHRVLADAVVLGNLVATTLSKIASDLLTMVAILILMTYFDWRLSVMSLASMPAFLLAISRFNHRIRDANAEVAYQSSATSATLAEGISMLKLTQTFGKESFMCGRFRSRLEMFARATVHAAMVGTAAALISGFFAFVGPLAVLSYGSMRVMHGLLSVGTLVAFYSYLAQLYGPIGNLANMNSEIQAAHASLCRVFHVLDLEPEVQEASQAHRLQGRCQTIEFRNVSFDYPGRDGVLRNVSFKIEAGEKVAIVGPSGAGKTTIVDLLCRFYDSSEGVILINGHDIKDLDLKWLRAQIAIVSQDTFLFDDSLAENIAFGASSPTRELVVDAARVANIHSFISTLGDRYETVVGERGVRLSGGQRQRIAIARAVLRNAPLILLDEATSSVDSIGERAIHAELARLIEGKTALIIAHRLSAFRGADRILLLDGGRIIAEGSHTLLLDVSPLYRDLFLKQSYNETETEECYETDEALGLA